MRAVGIRELKNKLSEYLRLVRAGEALLVTDRGEVIAEVRPPGRSADDELPPALRELTRGGLVRTGGANRADLYPRLGPCAPDGAAARLLDAERGER